MKINLEQYKRDFFTSPNLHKLGVAFYAIRITLLKAINELKSRITGRVLDVGCGVMPYKEFLLESNRIDRYEGVDLAPTQYHGKVVPDYFWDGKTLPVSDNCFDWVIATEFFEHYDNTSHILGEIARVLKNDGCLFFTVPCIWPLHEVPYDHHRFTPFEIERLLKKAGYFDIEIKALGGMHQSLATMLGLWSTYSGISGWKKKFFIFLMKPFYYWLIKKDQPPVKFDNYVMPSGLYGFARISKK